MACMTTMRTLIVVAAIHQWPLYQLDMKHTFLHGDLHKEVYMIPTLGFSHPPTHVIFAMLFMVIPNLLVHGLSALAIPFLMFGSLRVIMILPYLLFFFTRLDSFISLHQ